MSSLFNKSTGINLSSVLNSNSNNTNSNSSKPNKAKAQQHQFKLAPTQHTTDSTAISQSASTSTPVKQFSDKLKLQQHQYVLNTNSYLKTIDNCLDEASRTGELLLTNKSLIEFPSTIAFKYDLTDTLLVGN
jgi:hypothetical protein